MWRIYESKRAQKNIDELPTQVREKYEFWKAVVISSGPTGLCSYPGFRDHSLGGQFLGYRASRLNQQFRVIYVIKWDEVHVEVFDVNAHDYKRR